MVEVFRTNIQSKKEANFILGKLQTTFPLHEINFDLEDCDNILRMETKDHHIDVDPVITLITGHGYNIEVLPDVIPNTISIK